MNSNERTKLIRRISEIEGLTDSERSTLLGLLRESRPYGLVWEDKPEAVEERMQEELPILKEVKERALISDSKDAPNHILIEGDNLEALTTLAYTHARRIDVIYIDPPYNTGNKDFVYNDSFVDREDTYRHSKWLSFMSRRLRIAKQLLSDKGVIFISIDDNEAANLRNLCDDPELFSENNFLGEIVWETATDNNPTQISTVHEFILCYAKNRNNLDKWSVTSDKAAIIKAKYEEIVNSGITDQKEIRKKLKAWIKENKNQMNTTFPAFPIMTTWMKRACFTREIPQTQNLEVIHSTSYTPQQEKSAASLQMDTDGLNALFGKQRKGAMSFGEKMRKAFLK